ncbi:MAG: hypothetical protein V7607_5748 [Solirubrobacteraceae bacterium]
MRAINLIPNELRGGGSRGSAGAAMYVAIGVLALALVMVTAYTLTTRSLPGKRASVASVQRQASDAEARAGDLKAYTDFTTLRQKRAETVSSLAASRFDWGHTLRELSHALPANAWLSSVRASVTPTVVVDGATADPLRNSISTPALELLGCTKSHDDVAKVITRLRRMDGVQRVSLSSAVKSDTQSGQGAVSDSGGAGDCTRGSSHYPKFSLSVFLAAPAVPATGGTP